MRTNLEICVIVLTSVDPSSSVFELPGGLIFDFRVALVQVSLTPHIGDSSLLPFTKFVGLFALFQLSWRDDCVKRRLPITGADPVEQNVTDLIHRLSTV